MSRLPLAWRPGLVAAALLLVICAVARPSSVRRTWQRVRRVGLAVAIVAGELLVLVEHRVTRWCRAHDYRPLRPLGFVTEVVDRKVVQPCEARRSSAAAVPPVRRVILFTLVAAAFTPSAAWLAMGHWPSTRTMVGNRFCRLTLSAPRGVTPAFSNSCATALSSTPARIKRKAGRFMAPFAGSWPQRHGAA